MSSEAPAWRELPMHALLIASLVAMGLASGRWVLVGPLLAATAAHPLLRGRIALRTGAPGFSVDLGLFGYVALFIPVAIFMTVWEVQGTSGLGLNVPFHVALFLELVGLLKLYAPPDDPKRFGRVLFCSASAMATTGADVGNTPYLILVLAYACSALLALRWSLRRPAPAACPPRRLVPLLAVGLASAVALGLSAGASLTVRRIYGPLDALYQQWSAGLTSLLPPSPGGFSDQAQLGSVQDLRGGGRSVALRAQAARPPGYLRGRVFERYSGGRWLTSKPVVRRLGEDGGRVALEGLPPPEAAAEPTLWVTPSARYGAHFFLPLWTSAVDTRSVTVAVHSGNVLKSKAGGTDAGYGAHLGRLPLHLAAGDARWRELPDDPHLLAALSEAAARAGLAEQGERSAAGFLSPPATRETIAALKEDFARRYRYRFGIEFSPERDPLVQFLREKEHGHCELFAAAGTLLLRRHGIPARYVTGFLCTEPSWGGTWIARNETAHAWIEAYDPEHGWTIVELTPAAGVPGAAPASGIEGLLDGLAGLWARLRQTWAQGTWFADLGSALVAGARWLVGAWWRLALVLGGVVAFLLGRRRGRREQGRRPRPVRSFRPEVAALRQLYLRLEGRLARRGLGRGAAETLQEYAGRLEATPEFPEQEEAVATVRRLAALRYAPD